MLNRRLHEVEAEYNLFTLVIRPPSNYHWIAGREKFHEKLRDNIRRKYACLLRYRFFDEFDDHEQVHAHYIFMTDAPLDANAFKGKIRDLLEKTWRHVEKDMPTSLMPTDEEFHWATPSWLVVEDDSFDWSVYCDTVHNLTGIAKYLPKDLQDRSKVCPIPEDWPRRTRGGRAFFGKSMSEYWKDTYAEWYPPAQQHAAPPQEAQHEPDEVATVQPPHESPSCPAWPGEPRRSPQVALIRFMVMRRLAHRKRARGPPTSAILDRETPAAYNWVMPVGIQRGITEPRCRKTSYHKKIGVRLRGG